MEKKFNLIEVIKKYTMVIVLVLLIGFFYAGTKGTILYPQNINNLIAQNAYVFVLATAMLFSILTGGNIDLSVGSVVCFVGAIGGKLMMDLKFDPMLTFAIMVGVGILVGAWQGFWIGFVRIPPFICTLAGMLAFRGLSNVILNGQTLSPVPEKFSNLFTGFVSHVDGEKFNLVCLIAGVVACMILILVTFIGRANKKAKQYEVDPMISTILKTVVLCAAILFLAFKLAGYKGIPNVLVWIIVIVGIYTYISGQTTIGRYFYAVGGNEKASKLSGINTNLVYFMAYLNLGLLSAIAGAMTMARMNSANPTAGTNYEMDAIAACFIGGASAYGGVGTVPGVIVGALIMGVLNMGMSIMGIDQNIQKAVKGSILLAAVIFDVVSKRKKFINK